MKLPPHWKSSLYWKSFLPTVAIGISVILIFGVWFWPEPPVTQQVYCVTGPAVGGEPFVITPKWCTGDDPAAELWIIESADTYKPLDALGYPDPRVLFKVRSTDQLERQRLGLPATGEVPNGRLARPIK